MSDAPISRRLLLGTGFVVAVGGAGAWHFLRRPTSTPSAPSAPEEGRTFTAEYETARGQILAALPFLILPRETVDDFLEALSKNKRKPGRPDSVTRRFLLSTDFFATGADESRPLEYVKLYDPYLNPCYNPMDLA